MTLQYSTTATLNIMGSKHEVISQLHFKLSPVSGGEPLTPPRRPKVSIRRSISSLSNASQSDGESTDPHSHLSRRSISIVSSASQSDGESIPPRFKLFSRHSMPVLSSAGQS